MGLPLWKVYSSCISAIIMLLLRIISGISLLPSLIGFLGAYCISPIIHWMVLWTTTLTTRLWLALGPCPGFYSLCGLLGFPRHSTGFAGQWSFAPAILWVLWYLRAFSTWYSTGYDSNWAIRPFHGAHLILNGLVAVVGFPLGITLSLGFAPFYTPSSL